MKPWIMAVVLTLCAVVPSAARVRAPEDVSWEKYKTECRRELNALGVKIDVLEYRTHATGEMARERIKAEVVSLRARKAVADKLLVKLETSAGKTRKELKRRYDRAMRDLKAAYRGAKWKFG